LSAARAAPISAIEKSTDAANKLNFDLIIVGALTKGYSPDYRSLTGSQQFARG
jgi:hypothetical protein